MPKPTYAKITLPAYEERVLALGANGTGKTTLVSSLLASYPRWVALDLKGDFEPSANYVVTRKQGTWDWKHADRLIYRPVPEDRNRKTMEAALKYWYDRASRTMRKVNGKMLQTRPFIIYIDEGLYLSRMRAVEMLAALAVSGRSMRIGLWVSSQRPAWIPVEVRSEAWRIYVFTLGEAEDDKEVVGLAKRRITLDELAEIPPFWFYEIIKRGEAGKVQIRLMPPLVIAAD